MVGGKAFICLGWREAFVVGGKAFICLGWRAAFVVGGTGLVGLGGGFIGLQGRVFVVEERERLEDMGFGKVRQCCCCFISSYIYYVYYTQ